MKKIITIALTALSLSACQSTTDEVQVSLSCTGNWTNVGYDVAIDGKSVRTFSKYEEKCKELLGENAKSDYLDGYTKGIVEYCTYEQGFDLGESGKKNNKVCPHELGQNFERGFIAGERHLVEKKDQVKKEAELKEVRQAQRSGSLQ